MLVYAEWSMPLKMQTPLPKVVPPSSGEKASMSNIPRTQMPIV